MRSRIYYTETQRALMWERWQKGESLQHIAEASSRMLRFFNDVRTL